MITYSDYFKTIDAENSFFAGANTHLGFFGEYTNLLSEDDFDKIYMIKGGSGTGKSTIIRKCAHAAKSLDTKITYLLCSSDPESLDGVIIEREGKRIAVTDATAPHVQEPMYAGACGEIISCGDFWRSEALESKKGRIAYLVTKKRDSYKRAYRFLAASREVFDIQRALSTTYVDREKMRSCIKRICCDFPKKKGEFGKISYRRTCAVSMRGAVRLSSFDGAKTRYAVSDDVFLTPLFFEALIDELKLYGINVTVSLSPVFDVAEVYIPELDCAFVPQRTGVEYKKVINLRRFALKEHLSDVKEKRIFTSKCLRSLMDGAVESLFTAGESHFELESIYKSAMDFEGLSLLTEKLCDSIVKRLS